MNILFLKFENGISKNTVPVVFRFVSMFSLIFKKRDQQKCFVRYFRIRKYDCLILEKWINKKTVSGILRFLSMLLLIFENGMCKKTVPGILRFVSMRFFNI